MRPQGADKLGLELDLGGHIPADRVIAIPRLVGRPLTGIPADWNGFIPVDADGRVPGVPDVYAAGDATAFPVKQGGLATQQADIIAHGLAVRAGATVDLPAPAPVLRSQLLGADGPLFLRARLDRHGRPVATDSAPHVSQDALWWPGAKLFGHYLTPWMATVDGHGRLAAGEVARGA